MNHRRLDCTILGTAIAVLIAFSVSSGASAQTLFEPNPKLEPKAKVPPTSAKPQSALRTKSCSAFGAGFVQLPGTDTCVKVGGFVTMESTVNHGR